MLQQVILVVLFPLFVNSCQLYCPAPQRAVSYRIEIVAIVNCDLSQQQQL